MSDITERLSMAFNTDEGTVFRFNLEDPRADLTAAEVQATMNRIIANDVTSQCTLSGIKSADVIVTTKQKLI